MKPLMTQTPESRAFSAAFDKAAIAKQYEKLTDAPNLREGTIEVWYMKPHFFHAGTTGTKPNHDPKNLRWTHTLLGSIRSNATTPQPMSPALLDELWIALQGENWSPFGEANNLIRSLELQHTSMSVGDCFKLPNDEVWQVASAGFEKIE